MSFVNYQLAGDAESPSPAVWADLPLMGKVNAPGDFVEVFDDFVKGGLAVDTSVPGWTLVGTNADVDQIADVDNGVVWLQGSGADNDASYLTGPDLVLPAYNSGKRFWFETRVAFDTATGDFSAFVGLVENAGKTTGLIANGGTALIDKSLIGFFADTDGANVQPWNLTINQEGSGNFPVNVISNALAPTTGYVKFGLRFDGKSTLEFYVNGVKTATFDVSTLDNKKMAKRLGIAIGVKDGGANQLGLYVDWVRFAGEKFADGR